MTTRACESRNTRERESFCRLCRGLVRVCERLGLACRQVHHDLALLRAQDPLAHFARQVHHDQLNLENLCGARHPTSDGLLRLGAREGANHSRRGPSFGPTQERKLEHVLADLLQLRTFERAVSGISLDDDIAALSSRIHLDVRAAADIDATTSQEHHVEPNTYSLHDQQLRFTLGRRITEMAHGAEGTAGSSLRRDSKFEIYFLPPRTRGPIRGRLRSTVKISDETAFVTSRGDPRLVRDADANGYLVPRCSDEHEQNKRRHHERVADLGGKQARSHSDLVINLPALDCLATHSVCA